MSICSTTPWSRAPIAIRKGDIRLYNGDSLFWDVSASNAQRQLTHQSEGVWVDCAVYRSDRNMLVIAANEPTPHGLLLHLSVSYRDRNPSWRDLKAVKATFFGPEVDAMMVLPKEQDYGNVHSCCFHLWQMPVSWGIR